MSKLPTHATQPDAPAAPPFPLREYLDSIVEELRAHVPRALVEHDPTAIHQARVCTRRLTAADGLLRPLLDSPAVRRFARALKKLRRRLGPARDRDVMIGHARSVRGATLASAANWLADGLDAERSAAHADEAARAARDTTRLLARLGQWWSVHRQMESIREAVPSLIAASAVERMHTFAHEADALCGIVESATPQDPHELRITGKLLRYTLEMAAAAGTKPPKSVVNAFKAMQEQLGLWHDYVVFGDRCLQMTLDQLLGHHQTTLHLAVLSLAAWSAKRARAHLDKFEAQWKAEGHAIAQAIEATFPLQKDVATADVDAEA